MSQLLTEHVADDCCWLVIFRLCLERVNLTVGSCLTWFSPELDGLLVVVHVVVVYNNKMYQTNYLQLKLLHHNRVLCNLTIWLMSQKMSQNPVEFAKVHNLAFFSDFFPHFSRSPVYTISSRSSNQKMILNI